MKLIFVFAMIMMMGLTTIVAEVDESETESP